MWWRNGCKRVCGSAEPCPTCTDGEFTRSCGRAGYDRTVPPEHFAIALARLIGMLQAQEMDHPAGVSSGSTSGGDSC
jgi:hypothetical protein